MGIAKINGIPWASIAKIGGVSKSTIEKIYGMQSISYIYAMVYNAGIQTWGMCLDSVDQYIWIKDNTYNYIRKLDFNGNILASWSAPSYGQVFDGNDGYIWCTFWNSTTVLRIEKSTGIGTSFNSTFTYNNGPYTHPNLDTVWWGDTVYSRVKWMKKDGSSYGSISTATITASIVFDGSYIWVATYNNSPIYFYKIDPINKTILATFSYSILAVNPVAFFLIDNVLYVVDVGTTKFYILDRNSGNLTLICDGSSYSANAFPVKYSFTQHKFFWMNNSNNAPMYILDLPSLTFTTETFPVANQQTQVCDAVGNFVLIRNNTDKSLWLRKPA